MYLWRRSAAEKWAHRNEEELRTAAGDKLTVIERPDRKRLQFEVASTRRTDLQDLMRQFGGRIERLPADWLERSLRHKTKPIRVGGKRLTIPASAAFGTGEHATTALCLKMLERVMRFWGAQAPSAAPFGVRSPELVIDLGTGSGVLALAAKILGAKRVVGIDNDAIAIRTAKQNARQNKIGGVQFRLADVHRFKFPRGADVVTANLFSDLLIEILPRLRGSRRLILSGILRNQEKAVKRALPGIKVEVFEVRRRGKWVAILAGRT